MSEIFYEEAAMPYNPDESETNVGGTAAATAIARVKQDHEAELLAIEGVEGVGIGRNEIGDEVILVYVREADVANRIPSSVEGIGVRTMISGAIDAY